MERRQSVSSRNDAGSTGHPHAKKKKDLDIDLILFTKINVKWATDLTVKHKTRAKLLDGNDTGEKLNDLVYNDALRDDSQDTLPQ